MGSGDLVKAIVGGDIGAFVEIDVSADVACKEDLFLPEARGGHISFSISPNGWVFARESWEEGVEVLAVILEHGADRGEEGLLVIRDHVIAFEFDASKRITGSDADVVVRDGDLDVADGKEVRDVEPSDRGCYERAQSKRKKGKTCP